MVRAYGTKARADLGNVKSAEDLGVDFSATLTERAAEWLMGREFARRAERRGLAAQQVGTADENVRSGKS